MNKYDNNFLIKCTNCAPLLADLFIHAYEANFLQELHKNKDRKLSQTISFQLPLIVPRHSRHVLWNRTLSGVFVSLVLCLFLVLSAIFLQHQRNLSCSRSYEWKKMVAYLVGTVVLVPRPYCACPNIWWWFPSSYVMVLFIVFHDLR
jgi:hypothetical protein